MSVRVLIVADDFTGGNAAAGLLASAGLRCANVLARRRKDTESILAHRFDALIVTAETRHLPHAQAQEIVAAVIRDGLPADLVANRIDTTLRGNLSATTMGALEAVQKAEKRRAVALCVPAYPAAGRQTVDGHQLLDGVRLEETEAARDPLFPISSSVVADALTRTADFSVASIGLAQVTGPVAALIDTLARHAATSDALVVDALTDEHLRRIAAAAAAIDDVAWVAVDPGPFTRELAASLSPNRERPRPILAVAGSMSDLSRRQLRRLTDTTPTCVIDGQSLVADGSRLTEHELVGRVVDALTGHPGPGTVVLSTAPDPGRFRGDDANAFAQRLGQTVRAILERSPVGGLYLTGGDVASAVLTSLDAVGLAVEGEVVPLAVFGSIVGGPWDGTRVITKGGLVGDADDAKRCIARLIEAAETAQLAQPDDYPRMTRS